MLRQQEWYSENTHLEGKCETFIGCSSSDRGPFQKQGLRPHSLYYACKTEIGGTCLNSIRTLQWGKTDDGVCGG